MKDAASEMTASSGPATPVSVAPGRSKARALLATAVALVGALALWVWFGGAEERAILRLPEPERRALFERTLRSLETPCGQDRAADLDEYCRKQAEFVLQFPECNVACVSLARSRIGIPTR